MNYHQMTREEILYAYGLTEEDMQADVDMVSDDKIPFRFEIECGGRYAYFNDGAVLGCDTKDGLFVTPKNITEEEVISMMRECLKTGRNIFAEQWEPFRNNYPEGADY